MSYDKCRCDSSCKDEDSQFFNVCKMALIREMCQMITGDCICMPSKIIGDTNKVDCKSVFHPGNCSDLLYQKFSTYECWLIF